MAHTQDISDHRARPGRNPLWSSKMRGSMFCSKTTRTALANKRVAQFVTCAPELVTPSAFLGRKKRRL
eukprot:1837095-Pyramimonas_sp.AAC.1